MPGNRISPALCVALALGGLVLPVPLRAETEFRGQNAPLSAIDWLSQPVTAPAQTVVAPGSGVTELAAPTAGLGGAPLQPQRNEPPVAQTGAPPADVAVSVLDGPSPDAVGLLSPAQTGFPHALWGLGLTNEAAAALTRADPVGLPALQALLNTLLLAEALPPADSGQEGRLLMARVDKLLAVGALDQAQALLEAALPARTPELFRRSFDVALLTGHEDRACEALAEAPDLAPTLPTRVFCVARRGDWSAAALTLRTAQALGHISATEDVLLTRFLDAEAFEDEPPPSPPKPVTPLIWKLYEAIGEPLPSSTLPLAFAHADLSERAGWKAQVEAAERLARAGAISPNLMLGLFTQREPAASGGIWDRIDAFQRFEDALQAGDVAAVEQRLPLAYARMADAEIEVPFASLFAEDLARLPLKGDAARIAYDLGLLSPEFLRLSASRHAPQDLRGKFLAGLAQGKVQGLAPPDSMARAIQPAFDGREITLSADARLLLAQNRIGEALILAMARIETGLHGEMGKLTEGLALLRHLGLEDTARATALQLMLLERRG
ncbi:hypothetical protein [Tabrizicola sp.]|uniref:hypothetical protein n=1 Tax=Tabrizicola sp. TaxID=2005166 RepID=UPI003D2ABE17